MKREQELEKMMMWMQENLISVFQDVNEEYSIGYFGTTGSEYQVGDTFEECIRKAMQQEGEL